MAQARSSDDLELLSRLDGLSSLAAPQLRRLCAAMACSDVSRNNVIFGDNGKTGQDVYFLLSGIARLTNTSVRRARTVVALMPPGLIFKVPQLPTLIGHNFQCEALSDCRIGKLSAANFSRIAFGIDPSAVTSILATMMGRLSGMFVRYPTFLGLALRDRVAVALLELASEFGARNSRGTLLRVIPTHHEIADLVGGSRPKVTQILTDFERRRMIFRDGRRMVLVPHRLEELVRGKMNGRA
ncbi:MAG: Crp/Fnr family transcriptional regulator [Candidatus Binataceae bacterium]